MMWKAIERFGSSLSLFISNLILVRLLSPDDFGSIGMLMVFINIADVIVDGGFGAALIQKKKTTQADYSTIFYWNIFLSIVLYLILFFTSQFIADFYNIPLLCNVLKVLGIVLIMNALVLIQQNVLSKQIAFKQIAKVNLASITIGTGFGIYLAFLDFGIWSLVAKSLVTGLVRCCIYWKFNKWRPILIFDWRIFKRLFRFGSFMFINSVVINIYDNVLSLIIGKKFSPSTLGYYTQALKLEDIPRCSLLSVITNVTFPVFSQLQNDSIKLRAMFKNSMEILAYISFPLMMLLILIAEPLIVVLFTSEWLQVVPYFQILCINGIILSFYELNSIILIAIGKSNIFLFIRLFQCSLGVLLIVLGLQWGIYISLLGYVASSFASFAIIAIFSGKRISFGLSNQIKSLLPIFSLSLLCMVMIYSISLYCHEFNAFLLLGVETSLFIILYIILSILFKIKILSVCCNMIKSYIK